MVRVLGGALLYDDTANHLCEQGNLIRVGLDSVARADLLARVGCSPLPWAGHESESFPLRLPLWATREP